jgi:flagellar protein FlaF
MQHAAQLAYKNAANDSPNTRELEANLLLKSAARFQAIRDGWDGRNSDLNDALLFNRKLWTFFIDVISRDDNQLPVEVRRNLVSLGMFVINRTIKLACDPKPEGLGSLININRELAAGLLGNR